MQYSRDQLYVDEVFGFLNALKHELTKNKPEDYVLLKLHYPRRLVNTLKLKPLPDPWPFD